MMFIVGYIYNNNKKKKKINLKGCWTIIVESDKFLRSGFPAKINGITININ